MFNFLNTAVLAAAAVAILPFLLHLFSRRKVKVISFSSIAYLKAMRKRQVRAIKLKQIILLIIRTLIILAIVMAFARPATTDGYLGSHASVSAVILLDNSASMGRTVKDGHLFDLASHRAREIIEQLGPADEVAVVATSEVAGGTSEPTATGNLFGNVASGLKRLDQIEQTDLHSDLATGLDRVVRLMQDRPFVNREIYVISDFQQSGFTPGELPGDYKGKIYLVALPDGETDNSSVMAVNFGDQLLEAGTPFNLDVTVRKRSGAESDENLVSVFIDNNRLAQQSTSLAPGQSDDLKFNLTVNDPGFHSGYIMLSDDDLLADNRYYFSFYIPEQFSILLAGQGTVSDLEKLALSPDQTTRRHWSVQNISYQQLTSTRLNQYQVLYLSDLSNLSEGATNRILDFVRQGGGLFINIGHAIDTGYFNTYWSEPTGLELQSVISPTFSRAGHYLMSDFDYNHQILQVFKEAARQQPLEFKSFVRVKAAFSGLKQNPVLAQWSDGSPAITTASYGRGRILVFNCDIAPEYTEISMHPFFVPFMVRSAEFLSRDFSTHVEPVIAGATLTRNLRFGFNINNEYTLVEPDSTRRIIPGSFQDDQRQLKIGPLDKCGIYSIFNGRREIDRIAVNVDPLEGDLYPLDSDNMTAMITNSEWLHPLENVAGFISRARYGRELWHIFIICAILLMALEMWVARDRNMDGTGE